MADLVVYPLLFTTRVVTPLEVDNHCGSALRGNMFEAIWRRFCDNKASPTCADCPLHTMCPVSTLVAPLREDNLRGRDIPRPYIVLPPLGGARRYEPGEQFVFGLTLFGNIVQFLPYIILSISALEAVGLGRKLKENQGRRGQFSVQHIESYHPISGERQVLYQKVQPLVKASTLAITSEDIQKKAATLSTERVTLNFLTPTRLIDQEHLVHRANFRVLLYRLMQRLHTLADLYGEDERQIVPEERDYLKLTEQVQCIDDSTRWEDLGSYSHRQYRTTPIGGLVGKATFVGELAPFRELLTWGELIHIGKNCVKGNGWYMIEAS